MNQLISEKYKPIKIDDFYLNSNKKNLIKYFLKSQNIKFLVIGNTCSGKTSFLNLLVNEYFDFDNVIKKKIYCI